MMVFMVGMLDCFGVDWRFVWIAKGMLWTAIGFEATKLPRAVFT